MRHGWLFLLALVGCGSITDSPASGDREVLGTIEGLGQGLLVEVPDSVRVGQVFPLTVFTWGSGCVRAGPTNLTVGDMTALVVPFDTVSLKAVVCTADVRGFRHEVSVSFAERGAAVVSFKGAAEGGRIVDRSFPVRVR